MRSPRLTHRTTWLLTFTLPNPTPSVVFLIETFQTKSLSSSPLGISKYSVSLTRCTLKTPSSVLAADGMTCAYGRGACAAPPPAWRPPRAVPGSAGSCWGGSCDRIREPGDPTLAETPITRAAAPAAANRHDMDV